MFENDDWDIDEDYLRDFNVHGVSKNVQNEDGSIQISSISQIISEDGTSKRPEEFEAQDSTLRKNVVLDVFKKTCNPEPKSFNKTCSQLSEKTLFNTTADCKKNLVLDVFKKKQDSRTNSTCSKPKPVVKSVLKATEINSEYQNILKRKKNVAFTESIHETNVSKKICMTKSAEIQEQEILIRDLSSKVDENHCRRLNFIKSPVQKDAKVSKMKQAVVRKFPGPAGLLPDDIEESEVIDLDSFDENENKNENLTDVFSQNTKNLFTTGAWQLMMDDLPADFNLYDISTVKENALQFSRTYKKVPYLAGIIQYIDYKPNDPHVVLKDLSGKIDARIHHNICKLYPTALGTNIVLLVKDVGLIVTSKKYVCLIISIKNLVSIYSDEAKLVETSHLEQIENVNLHNSQISILEENNDQRVREKEFTRSSPKIRKTDFRCHESRNTEEEKFESVMTLENKAQLNKEVVDDVLDTQEFDFNEEDSWLGMNIENLNSFKSCQFPSSTPLDTKIENWNEDKREENQCSLNKSVCPEEIINHEILKKHSIKNSTIQSTRNSNHLSLVVTNQNLTDAMKVKLSSHYSLEEHSLVEKTKEQLVEKMPLSTTNNKLFDCDDNDTDDEILSQLDVDAIAASYNS